MPSGSHLAGLAAAALRLQADERLGRLTSEGHQRAFEELVRRHRAPMVAYTSAILGFQQAEEVVQEAFASLHTALANGDVPRQVRPWLYTVARNRALNVLRDERQHDQLDESYDGVPQPPDIAILREELSDLVAQIKDLPREQREALIQRELEGRSHSEIGATLGVSGASVRGLIFRARTKLRDGAGCAIPLPLLRALLDGEPARAAGVAIGGGAAAGLGSGSAALIAVKGVTVLAAVAALLGGAGIVGDSERDGVVSEATAANAGVQRHDNPGRGREKAFQAAQASDRDGDRATQADRPEGLDREDRDRVPGSPVGAPTAQSDAPPGESADEGRDADGGVYGDDAEAELDEAENDSGDDDESDGEDDEVDAEVEDETDPETPVADSSSVDDD